MGEKVRSPSQDGRGNYNKFWNSKDKTGEQMFEDQGRENTPGSECLVKTTHWGREVNGEAKNG